MRYQLRHLSVEAVQNLMDVVPIDDICETRIHFREAVIDVSEDFIPGIREGLRAVFDLENVDIQLCEERPRVDWQREGF